MQKKLTKNDLIKSYEGLEIRTRFDLDFILLTSIAAAICAFGFRMNSPSVIIGAMVLSPLLFTIVALSASLFRKNWKNTLEHVFTFTFGIGIAIAISVIINLFFPFENGSEITERILSSPLDYFFVAFFSGLGGTFAYFWPGIIEAIAGIAISVALIPPVVIIGIGLAKWDMAILTGSIQIVAINVLGIIVGSYILVFILHLYTRKD